MHEDHSTAAGDLASSTVDSAPSPRASDGLVVGRLCGFHPHGVPLVNFPGNGPEPVPARSTVPLHSSHLDREVVLGFENRGLRQPIVLGLLQRPSANALDVHVDGDKIAITAQREIELRCGKASITLTKAGKVIIRGAYVSSRSSGVNRIKGGSVQIN
jgi:hypothetical protein